MDSLTRADVLLHPVRLRIVQTLMLERPMTVAALGRVLEDVPQASLYRHLNRLVEAGFVEAVEERPVGGAVERVYAVVAGAVSLGEADLATATREDHLRYFTAFCIALMGSFERYLGREHVDIIADGVGYRTMPVWLSDEEFHQLVVEMNRPLLEVVRNEPGPGRRKRLLSSVVFPVEEGDEKDSGSADEGAGAEGDKKP